jgi:hypothetical protein
MLFSDQGSIDAPTGAGTYDKGSTVRIEAIESLVVRDGFGGATEYTFYEWSDGNTQSVRDIVLETDLTLIAKYNSSGLY